VVTDFVTGGDISTPLQPAICETDNNKVWLKIRPDYGVATSREQEAQPLFLGAPVNWPAEFGGRPSTLDLRWSMLSANWPSRT